MEWLIVGIATGLVIGFIVGRLSADKPPIYRFDGDVSVGSSETEKQKVYATGDSDFSAVYSFPSADDTKDA